MGSSSVFYIDTSVLISMLDRECRFAKEEMVRAAKKLLYDVKRHRHQLRVSVIALGELLNVALREEHGFTLLEELRELKQRLGESLVLCHSPRLRGDYSDLYSVVNKIVEIDDYLRDSAADVHILAVAILDREADVFYTTDKNILMSKKLKDTINQMRIERCFNKRLKIKPLQ